MIDAIDEIPKDIVLSQIQIDAIKQRKASETGNLESQLTLKIGAQVIGANLDKDDRLLKKKKINTKIMKLVLCM